MTNICFFGGLGHPKFGCQYITEDEIYVYMLSEIIKSERSLYLKSKDLFIVSIEYRISLQIQA